MKQFIVLAAVLPLMLLFVAQYAIDQRNHAATAIAATRFFAFISSSFLSTAPGITAGAAPGKARCMVSDSQAWGFPSTSFLRTCRGARRS